MWLTTMMQSAKCVFRLSLVMLIRDQWKPGLSFPCLFIYLKLMIFVYGNSRQIFEEAHIEELPCLFPTASVVPPSFSLSLCFGQWAGSESGAYMENFLCSTKDWCVSCHSGDSLRGKGNCYPGNRPTSSKLASWYKWVLSGMGWSLLPP